jgi:hypothetical protein
MNTKFDWVRLHGKGVITGKGIRGVFGLGLCLLSLLAVPAAFAVVTPGPATEFAVFQMGTAGTGAPEGVGFRPMSR